MIFLLLFKRLCFCLGEPAALLRFAGGRDSPAVDSQLSRLTSAIDSHRSAGDCNQSAVFLFCRREEAKKVSRECFLADFDRRA